MRFAPKVEPIDTPPDIAAALVQAGFADNDLFARLARLDGRRAPSSIALVRTQCADK
jgi:hypothetical protein